MLAVRRAVLGLAMVGLLACSSDADTSSGDTTEQTTPEDVRASAADVAAGLQKIDQIADDIAVAAASGDKSTATAKVDEIEPVWEDIEGTIKANDEDAYLTFEDSFALLGRAADDGDAESAQQAADTVSSAVSAYLAEYPG